MAQSGVVEPQEFESQWLKMLEEDEDANSLADDFSSSLRCDDMTLQALDEEEEEYFEDDEPTSSELDSGHEGSSGLTFGDIQFERIMAEFNNKEKNVKSELQSSVSPVIFENTTSSVQQTTTTKIETTTKITTITPKTEIPISPSKAHKRTHDLIESPSRFQLRPISSQPSSQDENVFKVPSRTASRSSSVCSRFTAERPPKSFRKAPEYESDEMVIIRRQKQIDFGKNTVGYDEYLRAVPRENRSRDDPTTPDKYLKYSRRSFDQQIKNWRKQLHEFDPNGLKIVNNPLVKVEEVAEMDPEAQKLANIKKMLDFDYKPSSSLPAPAMVKKEVSEIDCSDILDDADFEL